MKLRRTFPLCVGAAVVVLAAVVRGLAAGAEEARTTVAVIRLNGAINPLAAEYIVDAIAAAVKAERECLIVELDTPGGLMESTRIITKAMLASEVPVVVYVSPTGARAASAGVFLAYAAHVAAMAPTSNIGAAHPVNLGGEGGRADSANAMMEKVTNDAVAQIKAVAEKRGRNAQWAEEAIRKSVSITAKEALALNVIDLIAPSLDSLLTLLDGRKVELVNRADTLHTAGAQIVVQEMNWRHKLLDRISDPNIAYILMLLGIYGLFFELSNPGAVLPGVLGGIFLILGLYAMQTLPVNWAGVLLILFGVLLFIIEVKVTSYGVLTIGGIVAMFLGSLMLFKQPATDFEPVARLSLQVILAATLATAAFFVFAVGMVVRSQRRPTVTGAEGMIGEIGEALTPIAPLGRVKVHGEIWKARSATPIAAGDTVRVVALEGLLLSVEKVESAKQ
ncbi:MAG: nodulation protein NfeD [candidate division KSB1 bacterium]|nr:nodulation protein NfeD [candidate division KSB1 bacterium]MDZ7273329.1 nodulation protein NfeD [candidate division KSB1 bacterium]MDZ7287991.1 nodulation protein NfeD [candidate division KSB1 bacterium]MDZ7300157.1 nodulation protein NfeD [candidate division KSB1 bacterium]MDZ7309461.1 nodulation protein NfeD [candidate division KSB1 bacterium]